MCDDSAGPHVLECCWRRSHTDACIVASRKSKHFPRPQRSEINDETSDIGQAERLLCRRDPAVEIVELALKVYGAPVYVLHGSRRSTDS